MNAEAVLALFEQEGGHRGETCAHISPRLRFRECQCAARASDYHYREFIARGSRGGIHYICLHLIPASDGSRIISYGSKGYHHPDHRGGTPCV